VLLATLGSFWLFRQLSDTRDRHGKTEQQLLAVQRQLTALRTADEKTSLQEQIVQLRASIESMALPPRQQVAGLGAALAADAAARGLRLTSFEGADTNKSVSKLSYPAIQYVLKVEGAADSLVGLLAPLDDFPAVFMENLVVKEASQAPGQWVMEMDASVIYAQ